MSSINIDIIWKFDLQEEELEFLNEERNHLLISRIFLAYPHSFDQLINLS